MFSPCSHSILPAICPCSQYILFSVTFSACSGDGLLFIIARCTPYYPRVHLAAFSPDGSRTDRALPGASRTWRGNCTRRTCSARARAPYPWPAGGALPLHVVRWRLAPRYVDGLFSVWPTCRASAPLSLHLATHGNANEHACHLANRHSVLIWSAIRLEGVKLPTRAVQEGSHLPHHCSSPRSSETPPKMTRCLPSSRWSLRQVAPGLAGTPSNATSEHCSRRTPGSDCTCT
jgi:hypothetical protein